MVARLSIRCRGWPRTELTLARFSANASSLYPSLVPLWAGDFFYAGLRHSQGNTAEGGADRILGREAPTRIWPRSFPARGHTFVV